MSKSINLVEYEAGNDGRLYETKSELIETAFISSSLLDEILKDWPLVEKCIFEVIGSEEHYSIECFDDSQVANILNKLEDIFISILKSESERILGQSDASNSNQLPVPSHNILAKDLEKSINKFRTITNVINIFKLKRDQYSNDTSAVLKIG